MKVAGVKRQFKVWCFSSAYVTQSNVTNAFGNVISFQKTV